MRQTDLLACVDCPARGPGVFLAKSPGEMEEPMSWEDCGFRPGKIDGPAQCPKGACGECDGAHHFIVGFDEDDESEFDDGPDMFFKCKHCDAIAEMVGEDVEEPTDVRNPHQRKCACVREDAEACLAARFPEGNLFGEGISPEKCECCCHAEIEEDRREFSPESWEVRP